MPGAASNALPPPRPARGGWQPQPEPIAPQPAIAPKAIAGKNQPFTAAQPPTAPAGKKQPKTVAQRPATTSVGGAQQQQQIDPQQRSVTTTSSITSFASPLTNQNARSTPSQPADATSQPPPPTASTWNWWDTQPTTNGPSWAAGTDNTNGAPTSATAQQPIAAENAVVQAGAAALPPATTEPQAIPEPETLIILPEDLSVTEPMGELPPIRPPELKIIGRSVSFVADCIEKGELRDYYFEGMVAQITRDTVTMLEVLKFTVDGFVAYKASANNNNNTASNNTNNHSNNNSTAASGGHNAAEQNNHDHASSSRIAAVGTPLPRRSRGGDSATSMSASDGAAVMRNSNSSSAAAAVLSPELQHPSLSDPSPHIMQANNFASSTTGDAATNVPFVGGFADSSTDGGTALYDYRSFDRNNHYNTSSTMVPDAPPANKSRRNSLQQQQQQQQQNSDPFQVAPTTSSQRNAAVAPDHRTSLSTAPNIATLLPNITAANGPSAVLPAAAAAPTSEPPKPWTKAMPLAHYKFMTFARRKIRKVEFSTDHPMGGLLQPLYNNLYFRPNWQPPNKKAKAGARGGGGAAAADTEAGEEMAPVAANNNDTNNPYGADTTVDADSSEPTMNPQEVARRVKEKAKKKWKAQQEADTPVPCPLPPAHKSLVGVQRNSTFPFMGLNLRVHDPAQYKQKRFAYRVALRNFFEQNAKAKLIAPDAVVLPSSVSHSLSHSTARQHHTAAGGGGGPLTYRSGLKEGKKRKAPKRIKGPNGQVIPHDMVADNTAEGAEDGAYAEDIEGSSSSSEDEEGPLAPGDATFISLRSIDGTTLDKLLAEGAPTRPPTYIYPSTIADLYKDPKWRQGNPYILQDVERVRMFVRRFLVHTSQGNNQRRIPLLTFISQRCPWPHPPEALLREMLYDELRLLAKIEAELVAKATNTRGGVEGTINHPAMMGDAGEDMSPGRILLGETGVIARTTYLAIAHIAVSIGLLLYSASAFSSLEKYFVSVYANNLTAWVVAAAATHLFLGAGTGFHALKMKAPVIVCHAFPRILMGATSLTLMGIAFIQLIVMVAAQRNLFKGVTEKENWVIRSINNSEDICNFMNKNSCNGYDLPCAIDGSQCPIGCTAQVAMYGATICSEFVTDAVKTSLLPTLIIVTICLFFIVLDIVYLFRFVSIANRIARALF